MSSLSGRRLGRYQILEELGRGGMSRVFRATDTLLQRPVALKILAPQLSLDPEFSQRFEREAVMIANMRHANIVTIYDVGEANEFRYIAMEYIAGRTLQSILEERGRLGLGYAAAILDPVARALDYAHAQGAVHRDVKPHNIMIDTDGRVVLMDFGIAQAQGGGTERLTRTGIFMGTPEYISPEQASAQPVDGRSDLYSLGIVAYELLTSRPPFEGPAPQLIIAHVYNDVPSPRVADPSLPPAVDELFQRALAKRPDERFNQAGAFTTALRGIARAAGVAIPGVEELAALALPQGSSAGKSTIAMRSPSSQADPGDAEQQTGIGAYPRPTRQTPAQQHRAPAAAAGPANHARRPATAPATPPVYLTPDDILTPEGGGRGGYVRPRSYVDQRDGGGLPAWAIVLIALLLISLVLVVIRSGGNSGALLPESTATARPGLIGTMVTAQATEEPAPTVEQPTAVPTGAMEEPTPEPSPTLEPTPEPSPTPELTPELTPQPSPTLEPTLEPSPTVEPPTATSVPPTETPLPLPVASATLVPPSATPTLAPTPVGGAPLIFFRQSGAGGEILRTDGRGKTTSLVTLPQGGPPMALSPDGGRLAYTLQADGRRQIAVVDLADGEAAVLTSEGENWAPAWSPDGTQLAFVSNRDDNAEIYTMRANGGGQRNISDNDADDIDPSWVLVEGSLNILYASDREDAWGVWIARENGRGAISLYKATNDETIKQPRVSHDGGLIVMSMAPLVGSSQLYVFPFLGGQAEAITSSVIASAEAPSWSPDDSWIAYQLVEPSGTRLRLVRSDGSESRDLENGQWPLWAR